MSKTLNRVLSSFLTFVMVFSSVSIMPFISDKVVSEVEAATTSKVKFYAEREESEISAFADEGIEKVVSSQPITYSMEFWHYSGDDNVGHWKGPVTYKGSNKIYDSMISKNAAGTADLNALDMDPYTFTYQIWDQKIIDAIESGNNVYVNINAGLGTDNYTVEDKNADGVTLSNLFKVNTQQNSNTGETEIASNVDGTMLNEDVKAKIVKENGTWVIKFTVVPKLNFIPKDYSGCEFTYKNIYGLKQSKSITFVANGFGVQRYAMWRPDGKGGNELGAATGWVNQKEPYSMEGMPEGRIHPSMIYMKGSDGALVDGSKVSIDYIGGGTVVETISLAKNDIRIGKTTFKNGGAVCNRFDFPIVFDLYVGTGAPKVGNVMTFIVIPDGIDDNGNLTYEQIGASKEPLERYMNLDGTFTFYETQNIDTYYHNGEFHELGEIVLNDMLISTKDLGENTDVTSLYWDTALPEVRTYKNHKDEVISGVNFIGNDITGHAFDRIAGLLKCFNREDISEMLTLFAEYPNIVDSLSEFVDYYEMYEQSKKTLGPKAITTIFYEEKVKQSFTAIMTMITDLSNIVDLGDLYDTMYTTFAKDEDPEVLMQMLAYMFEDIELDSEMMEFLTKENWILQTAIEDETKIKLAQVEEARAKGLLTQDLINKTCWTNAAYKRSHHHDSVKITETKGATKKAASALVNAKENNKEYNKVKEDSNIKDYEKIEEHYAKQKTSGLTFDTENKEAVYLRYIFIPKVFVKHIVETYKDGVYTSTDYYESKIPEGTTVLSFPEFPAETKGETSLIEWRTKCSERVEENMPEDYKQKDTVARDIELEPNEYVYIKWRVDLETPIIGATGDYVVEQWRLSKYKDSLGYDAQAYMSLPLSYDSTTCKTSYITPSGKYNYSIKNPNGQFTDFNYNPSNQYFNDHIHSKALTQGNYYISHYNPSVYVDMSGTLNLIKGTNTFGINAAKWITTNEDVIRGLSSHNIKTSNLPNGYLGNDDVTFTDTLSYNIYNQNSYTHQIAVFDGHGEDEGCECYLTPEYFSPSGARYSSADYIVNSRFQRYIPKDTEKLSVNSTSSVNNGLTTVTYQALVDLKVYPEVAMLFENDIGGESIKWVVGDKARVISPVMHHTLQFKLFVDTITDTPNFATDTRALNAAKSLGNYKVTYKGAPVNNNYRIIREEGSKNTGILTMKTFALDIKDSVKSDWGNSSYNSLKYHNDFKNKWTMNGTATSLLEVDADGAITKGAIKTKNMDLPTRMYGSSDVTTFEHELIVRGGTLVGIKYMNRDTERKTPMTIETLQSTDKALYDALVSMKLIGNKNETVLKVFEHLKGAQLSESTYKELAKLAKKDEDGFETDNLSLDSGWYSEDTTVLVVKEYITNYEVPTTMFNDKLSLSLNGLTTPINKNEFFSKIGKGHSTLNYTFNSSDIGYGIGGVKVYFEHNSRLGSEFGKKKIDYLVGNASVTDTTRMN